MGKRSPRERRTPEVPAAQRQGIDSAVAEKFQLIGLRPARFHKAHAAARPYDAYTRAEPPQPTTGREYRGDDEQHDPPSREKPP